MTPLLGVVAAGILLVLFLGLVLYEQYLHPSWRKERRVIRACENAFDPEDYRLERLHIIPSAPSFTDLFPAQPFRSKSSSRHFTYRIETVGEAEPDFSGMSREEVRLVRRYLHHGADVPHYGKNVLHSPERETNHNSDEEIGAHV